MASACKCRSRIPSSSARPNLNKTILASDESKPQPGGYSTGGTPASATVPSHAAADGLPFYKKPYGMAAIAAGGLVLLLLLACLVTAPGASAERERMAKAKKELEDQQKDIDAKKAALDTALQVAAKQNAAMDAIRAEFERQRDASNRELGLRLQQNQDQKAQQILREQNDETMRKIADAQKEALLKQQRDAEKHQQEMELLRAQLKTATERSQTVIQYAAAPYYRYHPYYGWGY